MIVAEIAGNVNLMGANVGHTSGTLWAILAGWLYAFVHKELMPSRERLK